MTIYDKPFSTIHIDDSCRKGSTFYSDHIQLSIRSCHPLSLTTKLPKRNLPKKKRQRSWRWVACGSIGPKSRSKLETRHISKSQDETIDGI